MDINDKIQFWESEIERAEEHGIFFDPHSVAEVVKTVEQQQHEIKMLKKEETALYKTFATVKDILLNGINKNNNVCSDMEACTVSNIECLECLSKEAVKQLKESQLEVERLRKIETHLDRELFNEYTQNEFLKKKIERLTGKEQTQKK